MYMKLGSTEQKLASSWQSTLEQMRKMLDQAGGKPLSDANFETYRSLEDEVDGLQGRVVVALGQPWGPRIDPSMSRVERLQTREQWAQRSGNIPSFLEDTGSGARGGSGGGASEFRSFGQMLQATINAGTAGRQVDRRLFDTRAASGMEELTGEGGGFLVQSSFSYDLLQSAISQAVLAPRCTTYAVGPNSAELKLPRYNEVSRANGSRYGGIRLYWGAEATDLVKSKPTIGEVVLKPAKLHGVVFITSELAADVVALEQYVTSAFSAEFGFVLDQAICDGDGAGKPLGFLNSGALVAVSKESGQPAATLRAANIWKMYARMLPSSLSRAIWICNQSCWPELFNLTHLTWNSPATEIVSGVPIFLPGNSTALAPHGTLLGKPIFVLEQLPPIGTKGDLCFVDMKRFLLAQKGELQAVSSIHVRFIEDELCLKFTLRADGQCEFDTTIAPAHGSDALSAWIAIEDRT